jgi:hypothetical protein
MGLRAPGSSGTCEHSTRLSMDETDEFIGTLSVGAAGQQQGRADRRLCALLPAFRGAQGLRCLPTFGAPQKAAKGGRLRRACVELIVNSGKKLRFPRRAPASVPVQKCATA